MYASLRLARTHTGLLLPKQHNRRLLVSPSLACLATNSPAAAAECREASPCGRKGRARCALMARTVEGGCSAYRKKFYARKYYPLFCVLSVLLFFLLLCRRRRRTLRLRLEIHTHTTKTHGQHQNTKRRLLCVGYMRRTSD